MHGVGIATTAGLQAIEDNGLNIIMFGATANTRDVGFVGLVYALFGRHSRQRWRADWISSAIAAVERAEKGQDEIIEGEGREGDRVRILR